MAPKAQNGQAPTSALKGQQAEDVVLEYMLSMNRPFGYTDVFTNLHNAVQKSAVPKILASLADKGALTQKLYGKVAIFVANQANMPTLPQAECDALDRASKEATERKISVAAELKSATAELARIKSSPTDDELANQIVEAEAKLDELSTRLSTLRSGAPLLTEAQLAQLDADWAKWRAEWLRRRKVFREFWDLVSANMAPSECAQLEEDLGIERDSPEHIALERGPLFKASNAKMTVIKR